MPPSARFTGRASAMGVATPSDRRHGGVALVRGQTLDAAEREALG